MTEYQQHFSVSQEVVQQEETIKFYLEAFMPYIVEHIDWKDLLAYNIQEKSVRLKFRSTANTDPAMAVQFMLDHIRDKETDSRKYSKLVEVLHEADCDKVVRILSGKAIPKDSSKYKSLMQQYTKHLLDNLTLRDILDNCLSEKLIALHDYQHLNATLEHSGNFLAVFDFLILLPNKHVDWFCRFMKILAERKMDEIGQTIDKDYYDDIKAGIIPPNDHQSLYIQSDCRDKMDIQKAAAFCARVNTCSDPNNDTHDLAVSFTSMPSINNLSPYKQGDNNNCSALKDTAMTSINFDSLLLPDKDNVEINTDSGINRSSRTAGREFYSSDVGDNDSRLDSMHDFCDSNEDENFEKLLLDLTGTGEMTSIHDEPVSKFDRSSPDIDPKRPLDTEETKLKYVDDEKTNSLSTCVSSTEIQKLQLDVGNSPGTLEKLMKDKCVHPDQLSAASNTQYNITEQERLAYSSDEDALEDEDISLRHYQEELAAPAIKGKNVIIVAPTGSGKTRVALKIIQEHIRQQRGKGIAKVIFLVNQVALANQQGKECSKLLKKYTSKVITGDSQRAKSECLKDFIDKRDILIVTAQVFLDALVRNELSSINKFSLIIFDECHHCHANHTFNQIMAKYIGLKFSKKGSPPSLPQIVGLTASVGVGKAKNLDKAVEHIKQLMANLDAEEICTVTANIEELRDFVNMPEEKTHCVPKRENDLFGEAVVKLMNTIEKMMCTATLVKEMPEAAKFESVLKSPAQKGNAQYTQWVSKLWKETAKLKNPEVRRFLTPCRAHLEYYNNTLIIYNDARVEDAVQYLDSEMQRWKENAVLNDNEKKLAAAYTKLRKFPLEKCSINPKLEKLKDIIIEAYRDDKGDSRGIVFVKTRDLARAIVNWMKDIPGLRELNPIQFIGKNPSDSKGTMTKAEQDDVLQYFRDGKHKLIVATSVAEEGLDISKCNLVIRYDHVTNEIAMVQSRGRGRAANSKYMVIAEENTGMAEKEELNMIREIMMRKAIIKLQAFIFQYPEKFKLEIHKYQDEGHLDHLLKSLGKRGRIGIGDYELRCIKCDQYICMSSDIKKIENAHHVVVDDTLDERVKFITMPTSANEYVQINGKLICKKCGGNLGVIILHRNLDFPVLKIENFLLVDQNDRQSTFKRWKQVPFHVDELGTNDFRQLIQTKANKGDLVG